LFGPLLAKIRRPRLDWLQIAVTSYCNASCAYCPHTIYRRQWQSRHLSLSTFKRLLPDLKKIRLIYLQGWGEPFLNPDFFTCVSLAKQEGCRVGTTTNGTLLTEKIIIKIVESEIDVIAFSLAGIGENNDTWRQGTSYQKILEAIHSLQACKRRLGAVTPRIHIAYMLLRSGFADLARLTGELQGLGIRQVVISILDLVADKELAKESLAGMPASEAVDLADRLEKLAVSGAKNNLNIYYPDLTPGHGFIDCPENILRAAVISMDGDVSPCVYTNVPASSGNFYSGGEARVIQSISFGNVNDFSFREIWWRESFRGFRRSWERKIVPHDCHNCYKLG
jgi:MoaA/NifB/PqqE/SkfB family radical SAM enzyme